MEGARGLLVHSYRTDGTGALSGATITTPTAQNEAWLAGLLGSFIHEHGPIDPLGCAPERLRAPLEAAIREADPCLPCTSLPSGRMQVRLQMSDAESARVTSWLLEAPSGTDTVTDTSTPARARH